MARNYITLDQVISDFIITIDNDDYAANVSDHLVRTFALRGIREMGFDMMKRVRSIKLNVDRSNNTCELPDDYVNWTKIGVVSDEGIVYVLGENKNLNMSQKYVYDSLGNKLDSDNDGLYDRVDSKGPTNSGSPNADEQIQDGFESYIFRNFVYENTYGGLYGAGGGHYYGEFRINEDQNRIELSTTRDINEIVIEYICDEALSQNPSVNVYAEEALRAYIYYRIIERKASVPANEKSRARSEYYNERRKANARIKSFTKEEALKTIRKNFKQSPKF